LQEVARNTNTPLVDFVGLLESSLAEKAGHTILGDESFLDHVHPTIEGHRLLALSLLEELTREGVVDPGPDWGEAAIQQVSERVEGKIDPADQARALAQLAWTLDWAGKEEASRRLALQALGYGFEEPTILLIAARHRAFQGHSDEARELFLRALRADPKSPTAYYQYGLFLIDQRELEAAAAHFLRARTLWPADSRAHLKFGLIMAEQRRFQIALPALEEAERHNPGDRESASAIAKVKEMLGSAALQILPQEVEVEAYASGSPRLIVQTTTDRQGGAIAHGVWTEWFETGELGSYADYLGGKLASPVLRWEQDGTLRPIQSPPA
jgi:tetratricopeptide (TPR) repeat protein